MTTLTVNIEDKKTEKAVKVVLDAFGLDYNVKKGAGLQASERPLTKSEQAMYNRLKRSFEQIKLHQEGKIKLQSVEEALAEIAAELGE